MNADFSEYRMHMMRKKVTDGVRQRVISMIEERKVAMKNGGYAKPMHLIAEQCGVSKSYVARLSKANKHARCEAPCVSKHVAIGVRRSLEGKDFKLRMTPEMLACRIGKIIDAIVRDLAAKRREFEVRKAIDKELEKSSKALFVTFDSSRHKKGKGIVL
jgi:AraC-like DNA-binding protein